MQFFFFLHSRFFLFFLNYSDAWQTRTTSFPKCSQTLCRQKSASGSPPLSPTTRKKSDEKPKFRSVAHAIRAGIFVDRIYRRVSSTALMQFPPEVVKVLKVSCHSDKPRALNVRRAEKLEQTKTFLLGFSCRVNALRLFFREEIFKFILFELFNIN
jgi:hypothetical protein